MAQDVLEVFEIAAALPRCQEDELKRELANDRFFLVAQLRVVEQSVAELEQGGH
jgi:hypothetical protein